MGYGQYPMTPQVTFDFVQSEIQVNNYLVAPGNMVYLLDKPNGILYEKSYDSLIVYDLKARQPAPPATNSFTDQQKQEISEMIANALSQYNPHIPKKERRND